MTVYLTDTIYLIVNLTVSLMQGERGGCKEEDISCAGLHMGISIISLINAGLQQGKDN